MGKHFGDGIEEQAKFILQLYPISSDSPCHPVVPKLGFPRQREGNSFHRKVFWDIPGIIRREQFSSKVCK